MGDMNGEPLYCPLCGTLPSAVVDERRICPSCDQSMKQLIVLERTPETEAIYRRQRDGEGAER